MRVVKLSDHPADLLRETRRQQAAGNRRHRGQVDQARRARDRARAQRRWLTWLRAVLALRRERRRAPSPGSAAAPSDREQRQAAGVLGEQQVTVGLGAALGDEWVLFRGYRNRRGEIDHLLLGPRGLFAVESKHRNGTVSCTGDRWSYVKYDNYGNPVERGEITDARGRSPSEQVNQPATELEEFLRSRGHPTEIQRIVLLTHHRSAIGTCTRPTVHIATSTRQVISLIDRSSAPIAAGDRAELERLIIRDHRHHEARHNPDH